MVVLGFWEIYCNFECSLNDLLYLKDYLYMYNKLLDWVITENILADEQQTGFREDHSIIDYALTLPHTVEKYFSKTSFYAMYWS